ncbi:hypothetical protein HFD88_006764 [Aspergillus terreus]|nr:hypothetical protein HFD88_006764 [Aspergillus terreus]
MVQTHRRCRSQIGTFWLDEVPHTVDAIVGAVEWVFNVIKTAIEDLIRFVEFLFSWNDTKRTKNVLHNVVKLYVQNQVDQIPRAKAAFDAHVAEAEQTLGKWAEITDWSPIGSAASQPASGSTSNPAKGQTSGSRLLADHFQNQIHHISILGDLPSQDADQSLVDQLLTGLSNEGAVLGQTYNQLRDLASNFSSLNVGDVLKRLAVILADGVLSSTQVVVDALLDVLQRVAESAIDLLDTKMHMPIISDVLNAIGVPDTSFLDLFTWIAAVGYTVVYKIANGEAPFPDTSEVSAIISASTWDDLLDIFHPKSTKKVNSVVRRAPVSALITLPEAVQSALFIASHATAGFMLLVGDIVGSLEAEVITGEIPFSIPSVVLGVIVAAFEGGGNALVPKAPIDNTAVSVISDVTTAAVIVSKIVFSGPVQSRLGASSSKFPGLAVDDGRATGAIVNSVLIFPALFVTGWHFYELSGKPEGAERSAAIVGEVSNLTSYISRVSYAVAVNDVDPTTRQIPIGVMAVNMTSSDPCPACSWTTERQGHCSYKSHVKLFYEAGDRGVWSLGSNVILKDRGGSLPTREVPNIQFVQEQTSIPVPTVIESWEEGDHTLILMRRIPGEPLSEAWPNLSTEQRGNIARQTAEYLLQLRNLQADNIQALGGGPVYSNFLFKNPVPNSPHGPLASDDELWADMERGLKEGVPKAARMLLRRCMPSARPYTFTHSDLTNVNIIVENGSLTGIIDWETSGYFPGWWEYVCTSVPDSEEDREWKTLLRKYMPDHSAEREFWLDYYYLCRNLDSERAKKFIEKAEHETSL